MKHLASTRFGTVQRATGRGLFVASALLIIAAPASAFVFDEFEVFAPPNSEDVGRFQMDQHINYGFRGRASGEFPRALPTQRGVYLNTEITHGVLRWYAVSLELPSGFTRDGVYRSGGFKLRNLLSLGQAGQFSFDLLAEAQRQPRGFLPNPWGLQASPLVNWRSGAWGAALNVGVGASVGARRMRTALAPAASLSYDLSDRVTVAAEYYGDVGRLGHLEAPARQGHQLLAAAHVDFGHFGLRAGVARGLTAASDRWVGTLVVSREF